MHAHTPGCIVTANGATNGGNDAPAEDTDDTATRAHMVQAVLGPENASEPSRTPYEPDAHGAQGPLPTPLLYKPPTHASHIVVFCSAAPPRP